MPAIGGDDLTTLFVTSAAYPVQDHASHPHAGALLALEAPAPGLPTDYMPLPEDHATMSKTVGDFFVQRLYDWGVRTIFGYPGRRHQRRAAAR